VDSWTQAQVYVGNANADYQMAGILELELLKWNALRPSHHVLEIGCGALVGGRPFIQFLDSDRYVGIEPNTWLIEEARDHFPDSEELFATKRPLFIARTDFDASEVGRTFDFIFSHSILSHAAHWQLPEFIAKAEKVLAPNGIILASIRFTDEKGQVMGDSRHEHWQYPGTSYFAFETVLRIAEENGLRAENRSDYRAFFSRYLPTNFHDWIRLRRFAGGHRMIRPPSLYGVPDSAGKESS
jgi:cyclopropane fatty-acyl-phospholipid synthase-like methyltransferase